MEQRAGVFEIGDKIGIMKLNAKINLIKCLFLISYV